MSRIEDLLAEEGSAAEDHSNEQPLPQSVSVSRPNLGRPTVVSVRLSNDEHAQLRAAAEEAGLPVSTLIRIWAVDRLQAERNGTDVSVTERLARLEREVFRHTA